MADTLQSRVASPVADDDPFAELTRIMGFDPRQPVDRQKVATDVRAPLDSPRAEDRQPATGNDLAIDLERELMGELADGVEQHVWDVGAEAGEDVDRHHAAADDRPSGSEDWHSQDSHDAPMARAEVPTNAETHGAAEVSSSDDWDFDLSADLLKGVDQAAEPEFDAAPDDSWNDAHAEDAAEDQGWARVTPRAASASQESFVSGVDLPPIPLSRPTEAEAAVPEASDDASLDLALEHELGALLADPGDDGRWNHPAEDRHSGAHDHLPALATGVDAAHHKTAEPEAAEDEVSAHDYSPTHEGPDPYAALAALSSGMHSASRADVSGPHPSGNVQAHAEAPDIETVDVPEQGVPVAEELDLPEMHFEDQAHASADYDDIDAEFANLLNEMNSMDRSPAASPAPGWHAADPVEPSQNQPIVVPAAVAETGRRYAVDADYFGSGRSDHQSDLADMEFAYDPDAPEDMAPAAQAARRPRGRGYLVAAALAGVAVLGGVAVFLLPFGGGDDSSEIALVQADPSPVKVRPENPGGVVIPNQDNKVYDRVAGGGSETPTQEKLLQSSEEPLELPMPRDEDVVDLAPFPGDVDGASAKAEDRVAPTVPEEGVDTTMEVAAVPPRKVRTMIVKADGTLVAREVSAEESGLAVDEEMEAALDPIASATTAPDEEAALPAEEPAEETAAEAAVTAEEPAPATAAEKPAVQAATPPAGAPAASAASTPNAAPIAPSRPSDQPVDIVGEVQPNQQVAALAPAAAGAWSMQIASQPSEALAQASYRDLQRRFGKVLDGRQANIVKADIPGKGTFWRVRVPAGTRAEAVKLCETYKAAGGSCFVSK